MKYASTIKIAALLAAAAFMFSCIKGDTENTDVLVVGNPVPEFVAREGDSPEFVSPGGFMGKTTLLVFFTTWCPNCTEEMPKVSYIHNRLSGNEAAQVITIAREEAAAIVRPYWLVSGYGAMPWYADETGDIYRLFATKYIPRLYIIDPQGKIIWKQTGSSSLTKEQLLEVFEGYMGS